MTFLKTSFFVFFVLFSFVVDVQAESISAQANRIVKANAKKAELEKNNVKSGQTIDDIGNLSIDDFLKLKAIPEGMDPVSAKSLYEKDSAYDYMTPDQMVSVIKTMRNNGVDLPKNLEKDIKKNPDEASKLLSSALDESFEPANVENQSDIAKQRQKLIKESEKNSGIDFKSALEKQKEMMGTNEKKTQRRGHLN